MGNNLSIKKEGALDLVSLGALVHRLDPGIIAIQKSDRMQHPCQWRGIQCGCQPGRLFPYEYWNGHGYG